jgi:hypothetical protein
MRASTAAPFALALRSMACLRRSVFPRLVDGLGSTRLVRMAQSAHSILRKRAATLSASFCWYRLLGSNQGPPDPQTGRRRISSRLISTFRALFWRLDINRLEQRWK